MSLITGSGTSIITTANTSNNLLSNIVYFNDFSNQQVEYSKPPPTKKEDPVLWLRRRVDEVLFTEATA